MKKTRGQKSHATVPLNKFIQKFAVGWCTFFLDAP
jgi:hypothetical protein